MHHLREDLDQHSVTIDVSKRGRFPSRRQVDVTVRIQGHRHGELSQFWCFRVFVVHDVCHHANFGDKGSDWAPWLFNEFEVGIFFQRRTRKDCLGYGKDWAFIMQ